MQQADPFGACTVRDGKPVQEAERRRDHATGTDRAVHTVIMFADGCTRGSELFHMSVDRDGITVGAPIRGACTPIVWPRPDGDVPAPPPPVPDEIREMFPALVEVERVEEDQPERPGAYTWHFGQKYMERLDHLARWIGERQRRQGSPWRW